MVHFKKQNMCGCNACDNFEWQKKYLLLISRNQNFTAELHLGWKAQIRREIVIHLYTCGTGESNAKYTQVYFSREPEKNSKIVLAKKRAGPFAALQ